MAWRLSIRGRLHDKRQARRPEDRTHDRARARQSPSGHRPIIARREGVTLGGLKIEDLINEAPVNQLVPLGKAAALRRCPITRSEAQAMIAEVKGARLLRGFRGRPAADLEALDDTLVRVSYLAMQSYARNWVMVSSGGVLLWRVDDLDAVSECDAAD
ncbi:MAG: acetate--CoA ligase family protein, partial [Xanthobacteraceae bacterium]